MGILLLLLLIILQLNKNKSNLLFILSFIFMWITFGWNEQNPDKHIYEDRFDLYDTSWYVTITEPLYTYTIISLLSIHIPGKLYNYILFFPFNIILLHKKNKSL